MTELLISLLILVGVFFNFLGTVGLIRFPDVYTRLHAVTKGATLGVICVLVGGFLFFIDSEGLVSAKLLLGIVFVFLTAPVGGHMISRAAYRTGVPLSEKSVQDDLKGTKNEEAEA